MKHTVFITYLSLAYPPTSNYDFAFIKEEAIVQDYLRKSQLYMITQRSRLFFDNVWIDEEHEVHFQIRQETTGLIINGILPIRQKAILDNPNDEVNFEIGALNKNKKFTTQPYNEVDGFKFYDKDMVFLYWLTPERLISEWCNKVITVKGLDGWQELVKYKVLYIGKATDQDIWQRLTGHETLQEILSKEMPLQYGSLPTQEIALLLFQVNAYEGFDVIGNFTDMTNIQNLLTEEEIDSLFEPKAPPEVRNIYLDAEKAFVNQLNPTYNDIKFKSYPKSSDGLYNQNFDVFSYKIRECISLICNDTTITGSIDDNESDTIQIIGNKEVRIIKANT